MIKKSLAALAVLGAFSGSALAADVTIYGVADAGLLYKNEKFSNNYGDTIKSHSFGLESGVGASSRFGLTGTEDLGNGLKVGFKLENSFNTDDGTLGDGRLFGREASASVYGDFGTISMGRMGGVGSSAGTYNLFTANADAFDGGNNGIIGFMLTDRYDNMITYQTPNFGGVQATFQYSFKGNNQEDAKLQADGFYDAATGREGSASSDRYASFGLTGSFGALNTVLTYEYLNWASNNGKNLRNADVQDGQIFSLGGNYDFGAAKAFVAAQYFKGLSLGKDVLTGSKPQGYEGVTYGKGYALGLGMIMNVAGGDLTSALYYRDYDQEWDAFVETDQAKYYGLTVKYEYPLSKRTSVYTGAGYAEEKITSVDDYESKKKISQAFVGLTHKF